MSNWEGHTPAPPAWQPWGRGGTSKLHVELTTNTLSPNSTENLCHQLQGVSKLAKSLTAELDQAWVWLNISGHLWGWLLCFLVHQQQRASLTSASRPQTLPFSLEDNLQKCVPLITGWCGESTAGSTPAYRCFWTKTLRNG